MRQTKILSVLFISIHAQFGSLLDDGSDTDLDEFTEDFLKDIGGGLDYFLARGKRKKMKAEFGCDEDQCADPNACHKNGYCQNKCQGYTCYCNEGFVKKGKACISTCDEDQCSIVMVCKQYFDANDTFF